MGIDKLVRTSHCEVCNEDLVPGKDPARHWLPLCTDCKARYPDALIKATCDIFNFAMRLTTGELIRFQEAIINGDWVHLTGSEYHPGVHDESVFPELPHPCPRGIDVRISQIVWVADAPEGS
jgi:hypothetical protein